MRAAPSRLRANCGVLISVVVVLSAKAPARALMFPHLPLTCLKEADVITAVNVTEGTLFCSLRPWHPIHLRSEGLYDSIATDAPAE